jgi:uncharacterized membrane protein
MTQHLNALALRRFGATHGPYLIVLFLGAAWLIVSALLNHRALDTGFDLGIYDQVVWNISHGRFFKTTLVYETAGAYDHFEPVLALIAPLYWLFPDVRVLLVIQSLALALGSAPIYAYARYRFGQLGVTNNLVPLLPALIYLIYPPLHAANLNDFHEVALLPPLLGMALLGLLMGRRRLLWASLALCLLVKEDVTVTVLAFGLYIAILRPRGFTRRDGVILAGLAVLWGVLVLYVFYPAMTQGMPYPFVGRRYAWLGSSPEEAITGLASQPVAVLGRILRPEKLSFLFQLFAPLLFLPLLGWPIIFLAAPVLLYLMMSDYAPQWSIGSYYNPPLLAFLFFATIQAAARLAIWARRWNWRAQPFLASLLSLVLVVVVSTYVLSATGANRYAFIPAAIAEPERAQAAQQLIAQIPPDAAVSSEWSTVPHLSQRQRIYTMLARPAEPTDYRLLEPKPDGIGAPIYPYAAADVWPPVYHHYQTVATAPPFELSQLAGSVTLTPLPPVEPQPKPLELAAYAWLDAAGASAPPAVRAGETARLMLAWRRTGPLDRRYAVFVHLLKEGGPAADNGLPDIVAQSGHEPGQGRFPTTFWETWTRPPIVLDEQQLTIPAETPPGEYYVWAGAYDVETGARVELGGTGKTMRLVGPLVVNP